MKSETMVELAEVISAAKTFKCGDGVYPVLSMTMHNGLVFQDEKFKKEIASSDKSNYKVVLRNQLVVGFPIDEGVLSAQRITDAGIVSPAYAIWDINQNIILPEFLERALRCERAIQYYKSNLRGSTARRRSLPNPTLLAFKVPLPSIDEQKRILNLIHLSERIINQCKTRLEKYDELIKARFVELFGSGEYPQVSISELVAGKVQSVKKVFSTDDEIKYIDISSIDNKRNVMTGYTKYVLCEAPSRAQQHIKKGDIVVSTVRPNLRNVAMTEFEDDNLVASTGFCVLRAVKCLPEYLLAIVCSDKFTDDMTKVVTGANYPAIKDSDIMNYQVSMPPMELQEEFADFVKQVDKSKVIDIILKGGVYNGNEFFVS